MITKQKILFGLILLFLLSVCNTAAAAAASKSGIEATGVAYLFSDITLSDSNFLFINYLAQQKILNGYTDGSFHPREGLSRVQVAVVIVKAAKLQTPAADQTGFSDLSPQHWAAPYITAAQQAGYLKGYPDGSFHPEEKLTRAQGIALIMRLSSSQDQTELPTLKDMDQNHWAAGPMAIALETGMIGLSADGSQVYPEAILNRGALARALAVLLTRDPGLNRKDLLGTIKQVQGDVKLIRNGGSTQLKNDKSILTGDIITTGANGIACIEYPDGSSILIKENTELSIKESLGKAYIKKDGSPGTAVENLNLDLKQGTIFGALATKQETKENQNAQINQPLIASIDALQYIAANQTIKNPPWWQEAQGKRVRIKVDMPWGIAAIRGTFVEVSVKSDGSSSVSCLTGDAEVSGKDQSGQVQNTAPLSEGKSVTVSGQGNLGKTTEMPPEARQEFEKVQDWVVNTALQIDLQQEARTPEPVTEAALETLAVPGKEKMQETEAPAIPGEQKHEQRSTLDVVINALQNSGIQLKEEVKNELKEQLQELQKSLGQNAPQVESLNNINTEQPIPATITPTPQVEENNSPSLITYNTPGTYGPKSGTQTINKDVIINVPGITLKNTVIARSLTLAAGIGDGDVILQNVTVQGNTVINGGGANSVELIDCSLNTVTINRPNNLVRVVAQGRTSIGAVTLNSGARLEENNLTGAGFSSVTTGSSLPAGTHLILAGNFDSVNIQSADLNIEVENGSITQMNIAQSAGGTILSLAYGASINTLQVNAAARINGLGIIITANINANDVVIEPTLLSNNAKDEDVDEEAEEIPAAPVLTAITLSGTIPELTIGGSEYDLSKLILTGRDQYLQPYDITGEAVSWAVYSGTVFASIAPGTSILKPVNPGTGSLRATAAGQTSNFIDFTVNSTPFSQGAGYQAGAYDLDAAQPCAFNWTRQSRFTGSPAAVQGWAFTTGDIISSSPVVGDDGTIYVGSYDAYLYAINPDGTQKWKFFTWGSLNSSPAIGADGTIYVAQNKLYAINPDGTQKWATSADAGLDFCPALGADGTIYVASYSNKLYAFNPDGTPKWIFNAGDYIYSSPAIGADGTIYFGCNDGNLYAINPDGTQKWTFFTTGDYISSSPAIGADGTIYIGSSDGKLYAINPEGTQEWMFATSGDIYSSPAIGADGTLYVGSADSQLYAIDPKGTQKWAFNTNAEAGIFSSAIIGADGTVYVGSDDTKFYAVNPDGSQKWAFRTGDCIDSSPAIGPDGTIYVGSFDKKLHAISTMFPITGVTLNKTKLDLTVNGYNGFLTAAVQPATGTNNFTWTSDNPAVATVNGNGYRAVVTPVSAGTAYIIVTAVDGGITATCAVEVYTTSIHFEQGPGYQAGAYQLTAAQPTAHNWARRSSITGSATATPKWTFATGGAVYSSPAIGEDGTIYVGSYDQNLYAINPDGTQKWVFTTEGAIVYSSPAIGADGTIYVVSSYDNKLYALNPDGSEKWVFVTGARIFSSPAIGEDGTIYIGSYDGKLYAINPDGTQKWAFATGSFILSSSPAIGADGTIYVGTLTNRKLYAINPDGTQKWAFVAGGLINSSPAIGEDGMVYVGSNDGKLYAISPDGTKKWAYLTGGGIISSPAIDMDGTIYVGSYDKKLYAINSDGTRKWILTTGNYIQYSSPLIGGDGSVYVGSYDKNLYAINSDGTQKWAFTTGGTILSSPAMGADGTIYVGSSNGSLYAIGTP